MTATGQLFAGENVPEKPGGGRHCRSPKTINIVSKGSRNRGRGAAPKPSATVGSGQGGHHDKVPGITVTEHYGHPDTAKTDSEKGPLRAVYVLGPLC